MNLNLPEIYQLAVISTAHMTLDDSEALNAMDTPVQWVHPTGYGWLVRLYAVQDDTLSLSARLAQTGLSEGFASNLTHLYNAGIQMVHLDCDGPLVEELETWNW